MITEYQDFTKRVLDKTGIDLQAYKEQQMKRRLTSLYEKKGFSSFQHFFEGMVNDPVLLDEFLDRMTINVSEFYRNSKRWDVLEKKILPNLLDQHKRLKVWSAACSTGEEPYTIAMILSKFMPMNEISILATDIDQHVLQRAKKAVYPERSLEEVPSDMKKKYFVKEGSLYHLDEGIKKTVVFKNKNLLSDAFGSELDLIVCRNVLIYFTEKAKDKLFHKFSKALKPGGILFVGSTEQIFQPANYQLELEDTFFYRKK
jgi:chemotaxis protein methyltransferase CheR